MKNENISGMHEKPHSCASSRTKYVSYLIALFTSDLLPVLNLCVEKVYRIL